MTVASAIGSFALVAGLLTIIPGLDTTLVLRAAISKSRRHAFLAALGIGTGSLIWGIAASVGISALLTASTMAYTVLRIAGAGYMLWLGLRLIRTGLFGSGLDADARGDVREMATLPPEGASSSGWQSWSQGLLTNLLNPKIGAFYVSVLPQFIPAHTAPLLMGVLLALVHDVEGLLWFTMIILGAQQLRGWLRRSSVHRSIDALTGTALVGFGVKLGLSGRP